MLTRRHSCLSLSGGRWRTARARTTERRRAVQGCRACWAASRMSDPVLEDDQLELERLFVQIMASAAMTHAHLAREAASTAEKQVQENAPTTG